MAYVLLKPALNGPGLAIDVIAIKSFILSGSISETLKLISEYEGINIALDELYENKSIRYDENVFDMLKKKQSDTVFQMESDLFKSVIKDMQPTHLNDLIALTALC